MQSTAIPQQSATGTVILFPSVVENKQAYAGGDTETFNGVQSQYGTLCATPTPSTPIMTEVVHEESEDYHDQRTPE